MKVVMVGSGNVGTVLAKLISTGGHTITQVISRNVAHAKALADVYKATYIDFSGAKDTSADIFILATSDTSLTENFSHFTTGDKLVVHTAGSVSKDVLKKISPHYGVLYPLQSLRKELADVPTIPFLIDGNNDGTIIYLNHFASTFSNSVTVANDDERLRLHMAGVIVNNFTNYLYGVAEDFCEQEKVDFNLLKPLIMETANRVQDISPRNVQTGPAVRKDILTLEKHLRILSAHPKLRTTYTRLTDSIMNP